MNIMSFRAVTLRLRPNKHQQKVLEETRLVCMGLWNHLNTTFPNRETIRNSWF